MTMTSLEVAQSSCFFCLHDCLAYNTLTGFRVQMTTLSAKMPLLGDTDCT